MSRESLGIDDELWNLMKREVEMGIERERKNLSTNIDWNKVKKGIGQGSPVLSYRDRNLEENMPQIMVKNDKESVIELTAQAPLSLEEGIYMIRWRK